MSGLIVQSEVYKRMRGYEGLRVQGLGFGVGAKGLGLEKFVVIW